MIDMTYSSKGTCFINFIKCTQIICTSKGNNGMRCWMLGAGCWRLDAGYWMWLLRRCTPRNDNDVGSWVPDARFSILGSRRLGTRGSVLDVGYWMLDARCWMWDIKRRTWDVKPCPSTLIHLCVLILKKKSSHFAEVQEFFLAERDCIRRRGIEVVFEASVYSGNH